MPRVSGDSFVPSRTFEAGHLSIGTGRRISTDRERITESILDGELRGNEILKNVYARAASSSSTVHLMGLLSEQGNEASTDCLFELLKAARDSDVSCVNVHCILDGKNSTTGFGRGSIPRVQDMISDLGVGRISSICGRFYAMDTGGNWERTARAFTMLVHGDGNVVSDAEAAVANAVSRGISEEFLSPMIVADNRGICSERQKRGHGDLFQLQGRRLAAARNVESPLRKTIRRSRMILPYSDMN